MMSVPLLDLKAQFAQIRAEVMPAIERVCASQQFILGEEVRALEAEIAQYCGASEGIGVSSGTDALLLALMALGIGAGDEVITPPFTFFATAGTIARAGARPVFCDIDPVNYNLSPAATRAFIDRQCVPKGKDLVNRITGGRIRALMPVHLYGQSADMEPLMQIARRYDLRVIEDAAQAIGTEYKSGVRVGSIGDIGCFSFFPSKNLGAFGDAGLCTTNDPDLAERMRVLRVHGGKPKYFHALIGGNFRIDELQAAILRVKLKYLDGWTQARQRNAAHYDRALAQAGLTQQVITPRVRAGGRHIFNQYVVRVPRRDALKTFLGERRVGTEIYYPVPLHLQECFAIWDTSAATFPDRGSGGFVRSRFSGRDHQSRVFRSLSLFPRRNPGRACRTLRGPPRRRGQHGASEHDGASVRGDPTRRGGGSGPARDRTCAGVFAPHGARPGSASRPTRRGRRAIRCGRRSWSGRRSSTIWAGGLAAVPLGGEGAEPHHVFQLLEAVLPQAPQYREASVTAREFAPGERVEVDYAGEPLEWIELKSGEIRKAWVFVAGLGFSQLLFAWAAEGMRAGTGSPVIGACSPTTAASRT